MQHGFARIQGQDIPLIKAVYTTRQNTIGIFTVDIPLNDLNRAILQGSEIELYWRNNLIVSGLVTDQPSTKISDGRERLQITLSCEDQLTYLACVDAKFTEDAHYQNIRVVDIFQNLLGWIVYTGQTPQWTFNDISTMIDSDIRTTLDLRTKSTIWSQLIEVVKSVPRVFARYAGVDPVTGNPSIAIGAFGELTHWAYQHDNLLDARLNKANARNIRDLVALSGRSADSPVSLGEATITPEPDFPILESPPGSNRFFIRNLSVAQGCSTLEYFQITKTKNQEVADTDSLPRSEVANALYYKGVRFLQRNTPFQSLSTACFFLIPPLVGDRVWIRAWVSEPLYNEATEEVEWVASFFVDEPFVMTSIKHGFTSVLLWDELTETGREADEYMLDVTDNEYADVSDDALDLFELLKPTNWADRITSPTYTRGTNYVSITHDRATDPTDCGASGKTFTFPLGTVPSGSTQVFGLVIDIPPGVSYTITQNPSLPSTPMILCVADGDPWLGVGTVTVQVKYDFL